MNKLWRASCFQVLITFLLMHQNQAKEKERFGKLKVRPKNLMLECFQWKGWIVLLTVSLLF